MNASFCLSLGDDRWHATVPTTGPLGARFQHGGPPSALLARAIEQCSPRDNVLIARMTVDILGAILWASWNSDREAAPRSQGRIGRGCAVHVV